MPWSHPARRMKEVIQAIHAIWDSWYEGQPLNFQGEFYAHTLMTPMFTPLDTQYGRPPIDLGAVGPLMTKVAAEVADGLISHSFTTERYLREVTLPAIEAGRAQRTHSRGKFEISGVPFVVTGETEEALAAAKLRVRKQIAFYASTPSYRGVLDLHGWGALHEELHPMSREGRWDEMGTRINDEVLNTIAVVGTGEEVVAQLRKRYTGIFDRVAVRFDAEGDKLAGLLAALKA
jgi:probable F420-dependent oxidoreductase